jgi:beta-glucosidase
MQGVGPGRYGPDKILCTPKHLVADGDSLRGGNGESVEISEATLRETAMLPFEAVIREAGAGSIMPAHHALNRIPCHANRWLLTDVLRDEWGFDGFVVSDNGDIAKLYNWDVASGHYFARDHEQAGAMALSAGIDSELSFATAWTSPRRTFGARLVAAVEAGRIPVADLDRAVANVLRAKFRLGLFDDPLALRPEDARQAAKSAATENTRNFDPWAEAIRKGHFDGLTPAPRPGWRAVVTDPAHEKAALEAAEKSIVLLKNQDALLPLDIARLGKIAVLGPNAADRVPGGYSGRPRYFVSVLEGIRRHVGSAAVVTHAPGCGLTASDKDDIPAAVALAREADLAIVVVGTSRATMGENLDRAVLELTGRQEELVRAVHATGKPVVVVLIHGGALAIPWLGKNIPAIVSAWYAGQETGNAVARVLFGAVNPGGKLPVTFPSSTGMAPCYYNALPPSGPQNYLEGPFRVTFPFGHGLSYTTFQFGGPRLAASEMSATPGPSAEENRVSVAVTNTGSRAGDAVVQLYVKRRFASTVRPPRELKGFARITLAPGETREVSLPVGFEQLKSWLGGRWQIEPGEFVLQVGPDSVTGRDVKLVVR